MATAKRVQTSAPAAKKKYAHTQAWYADAYGKSLPTIKRWWKAEYPLDDPDAMGDYLSSAGRKSDEERAADDVDVTTDADSALAEARLRRFGSEFLEGEGLVAEIRRLRVAAKHAAESYAGAGSPKERENRLNEWTSLLEVLRKIEKDNPEILRDNARTLPIEEVEEGVTRLLFDIVERFGMLPLRGMQTLVGLDAHDIRDELEREVQRALQPIRECRWIPEEHRAQLPVPDSGTPAPAAAESAKPAAKKKAPRAKQVRVAKK